MRKAIGSSLHSITAGISNLSKAGGNSSNLSHLKASEVGILASAGRSGSVSELRTFLNDLSGVGTVSAVKSVDPSGSVVNTVLCNHSLQKSFPLNDECYGVSRCAMYGFGVRAGKDCRRRHYANPERSSSYPQNAAEGADAYHLHLQGYRRDYSSSQDLDMGGEITARDQRAVTQRPLKDTLLSSPGAIAADMEGYRLFIADTNHHRIIIADGDGKLVDCIGSSSGLEDGTFESAQLCCPASAVFDADHNCLYIADSENHLIRRADLSTRILSTIKPPQTTREITIWGRFLRRIGFSQQTESEDATEKAGNYDILRNPWHVNLTQEGSILVASRCFENVWAMDSRSAEVTELRFQDFEAASEEFCRNAIGMKEMEDVYSLVLQEMKGNKSTAGNAWQISSITDIVSRVVRLHNNVFFIDTECQIIRKFNIDTGSHGTLQLSNVGILGLPNWWSLLSPSFQSPKHLNTTDNMTQSIEEESDRREYKFHIQPGRCLLCIDPVLPRGTVLAAPLEDGSIWRQAKGSVVELSMSEGRLMSHKITMAQQWIDDLDHLDDPNPDIRETEELTLPPQSKSGIPLYTLLDASLGSGEVMIDAVLQLKYACPQESNTDFCVRPGGSADMQERASQLEDQVYLEHLQVTVRLEIATSAPEERTKHMSLNL